ncbi:DNA topoisomerase 3 [Granulosicoccus sp.]|nr:DNA topoisomerase 3 [Granulosicoccus sp.]MDB4223362.1 DNA topoisomerase 3 [Granulosicoccus sp.]
MTRLFIAEKPSAAKAIADGLGKAVRRDGYYECGDDLVSYCIGHLFSQKEPDAYLPDDVPKTKEGKKIWRACDLPIIPEIWQYEQKKETKGQLKILGTLIKRADEIVHAGDVDREGQAIVDQVIEHFKAEVPVKRFSVSAQDAVSITRGLQSLKDNNEFRGWRNAALGRQRADWLVGMNVTRALTLAAQASGDKSLLVVGRVQSPTLALVVSRDRLIEKFVPKNYFLVHATIKHEKGEFIARWVPPKDSDYLDDENRVISKTVAEKVVQELSEKNGRVASYSKEPKSTPQPLGLSLSDITLIASNRFGFSADETLKTVQALYETHKLCSYPRSDCKYLPEAQKSDAKTILAAVSSTYPAISNLVEKTDTSIHSRIWNDGKITAHHAIIPTMHSGNVEALSSNEKSIYDVIVRSYLTQFYPKHEYDATIILINVDAQDSAAEKHTLKAAGNVVTIEGWKVVNAESPEDSEKTANDDESQMLPTVKESDHVGVLDAVLGSKITKPPKHFTEGTLIKALENIHKYVDNPEYKKLLKSEDGIGTPATRSSIITELKRRKYLDTKAKYLMSSSLGRRLIDTLPESVTNPVLTAQCESELLLIQNRKGSVKEFLDSKIQYVTEQVANAASLIADNPAPKDTSDHSKKDSPPCPECNSALIRRKDSRSGKGFWWGCSGYPECRSTYPDKRGKPDFKSAPSVKKPQRTTDYKCHKCESDLIARKSEKGTVWYGCSAFPTCKERNFDKDGAPNFG